MDGWHGRRAYAVRSSDSLEISHSRAHGRVANTRDYASVSNDASDFRNHDRVSSTLARYSSHVCVLNVTTSPKPCCLSCVSYVRINDHIRRRRRRRRSDLICFFSPQFCHTNTRVGGGENVSRTDNICMSTHADDR